MKKPELLLKKGREKSVMRFHPWIFSGAVDRITGVPAAGAEVRVLAQNGDFLARGFYSPEGQICCRLCRWNDADIDAEFLRGKILRAARLRREFINEEETNAYRVFNSEGDGIPGLIIDRYHDVLVVQLYNHGVEALRPAIVEILEQEFAPAGIYEKSHSGARAAEGLPARSLSLTGEADFAAIRILENGRTFCVDIAGGQKTGFYLDQRENRELVARITKNKLVLNCHAYTGAFAVAACAGGARKVVNVETSESALAQAKRNLQENEFSAAEEDFVNEDVFAYLRRTPDLFDMIILDPPALAKHRRDVNRAARAYKDLNLQAMKKLAPEGVLFTASCSQHVSADLFQKIVFAAAADARRSLRIIAESGHPVDHPVSIFHPEGRYLSALLLSAAE